MKAHKDKQDGFTIVELLTAVVVIGIVGTAITSMFLSIQQMQVGARHLETATRAAQREVETLRNRNYLNLTPGEEINFTNQLPDTLPANRTGTVTVSEPLEGLRRVDVRVTYTHSNKDRVIELSSLIGVIGITQ